jgi:hypothetical protein
MELLQLDYIVLYILRKAVRILRLRKMVCIEMGNRIRMDTKKCTDEVEEGNWE